MCPCRPSGRPSSWRTQSSASSSSSVAAGDVRQSMRVDVEGRGEELGEDPGLAPGDGEVGEEARMVPVRDPGQEHLVEVAQDVRERLRALGRRRRQPAPDLAGLHLGEHRAARARPRGSARPSRASRRRRRGSPLTPSSASCTCAHVRVFTTCSALTQPRRACATAELEVVELVDAVRVGRDHDPTPASAAARAWLSVRSSRSGCALISRNVPVSTAFSKTALEVEVVGRAPVDLAPGRVPDAVHVRVLHCRDDAIREALARLVEARVDRRHDPVALRQSLVVVVEAAVGRGCRPRSRLGR